jgi:hypothetical protein
MEMPFTLTSLGLKSPYSMPSCMETSEKNFMEFKSCESKLLKNLGRYKNNEWMAGMKTTC